MTSISEENMNVSATYRYHFPLGPCAGNTEGRQLY